MSLVIEGKGDPIHYPKNPARFEFDAEIAEIFENMAVRSIPMYAEMHRIHAMMVAEHIARRRREAHILIDVGASTGTFYKVLQNQVGFDLLDASPGIRCLAVDTSMAMLDKIQQHLPFVEVYQMRGHEIDHELGPQCPGGADIICMHYLLQFVPLSFKEQTLRAAYKLLRKNGMLFLGQKEAASDIEHKMVSDVMKEAYHQFRRANGYTQQEIDAKTRALQGSMWLTGGQTLKNLLFKVGFTKITETTRWCQFSSTVAVKTS